MNNNHTAHAPLAKTFYDAIYEWVAANFGETEADDPSWNIDALAEHLAEKLAVKETLSC